MKWVMLVLLSVMLLINWLRWRRVRRDPELMRGLVWVRRRVQYPLLSVFLFGLVVLSLMGDGWGYTIAEPTFVALLCLMPTVVSHFFFGSRSPKEAQ